MTATFARPVSREKPAPHEKEKRRRQGKKIKPLPPLWSQEEKRKSNATSPEKNLPQRQRRKQYCVCVCLVSPELTPIGASRSLDSRSCWNLVIKGDPKKQQIKGTPKNFSGFFTC
jgi:hypothetical protein